MTARTAVRALGAVLVSVAIATAVLLGTAGWFGIGFGMMTDCTNNYSCTETGCSPCATTGRWINLGAAAQWALVVAGVVVLVLDARSRLGSRLAVIGAGLLTTSLLVVVGTTVLAEASYCQPGSPGYADSYCDVGD